MSSPIPESGSSRLKNNKKKKPCTLSVDAEEEIKKDIKTIGFRETREDIDED